MDDITSEADLALLRLHEPVLCFTSGELFFPMGVEPYVRRSSLWTDKAEADSKLLVPKGMLDIEGLVQHGEEVSDRTLFMRFVDEPLTALELQHWSRSNEHRRFRAPDRLSRVGFVPRIADAIFSLSLLLRGTVPGGTVARATQQYDEIRATDSEFVYYGRVLRSSGYIVLNYHFFYAMNDWRSTFHGANDHEADWEQLFIFLDEKSADGPVPAWIACAAHDAFGDDLRRRWDDPDLQFVDGHPVVFIGAGSHATYFIRGEYLTPVELRFMRPVLNAFGTIERVWRETLKQGIPNQTTRRLQDVLKIPFVDYARGDGRRVGPDQDAAWSARLISDETDWVDSYRGLWGLDTRDRFGGERAPAGPKYNRDGTVRLSWNNPLGWSGLEKVPPPSDSAGVMRERLEALEAERSAVEDRIATLTVAIPKLELEVQALRQTQHLSDRRSEEEKALGEQVAELDALYRERAQLTDAVEACSSYLERIERGDFGDPKAHIQHLLLPQGEPDLRRGVIVEIWSALSVGLLLLALVVELVVGLTPGVLVGIVIALGAFVLIEATVHKGVERLLLNLTVLLAVVTAGVLVYEFFPIVVLVVVVAIALIIMTDNLRELLRR
jgi:hypothetical protein